MCKFNLCTYLKTLQTLKVMKEDRNKWKHLFRHLGYNDNNSNNEKNKNRT